MWTVAFPKQATPRLDKILALDLEALSPEKRHRKKGRQEGIDHFDLWLTMLTWIINASHVIALPARASISPCHWHRALGLTSLACLLIRRVS
jgi:hypothetical protein